MEPQEKGLEISEVSVDPQHGPPGTAFDLEATIVDDHSVVAAEAVLRTDDGSEVLRRDLTSAGGDLWTVLLDSPAGADPGDYSIDIEATDSDGHTLVLPDAVSITIDACFALTLTHTGSGADPIATPQGDGRTWTAATVDSSFTSAHSLDAADVDGDGDMDLVGAARGDDLAWWENTTGDGTAWTEHVVSTDVDDPRGIAAADVDGDGDPDLLVAVFEGDSIDLWINSLGDGSAWSRRGVANGFDGAHTVRAADIDGDGDLDVLGAGFWSSEISLWENLAGDGSTWAETVVGSDIVQARGLSTADMDGDGDLDVLGSASVGDEVYWFESLSGDGSSWAEHFVGASDSPWSVAAADLDGDGDLDYMAASSQSDDATWWENLDGGGTSWLEHVLDGSFNEAKAIDAGDIDGDGDLDVVAGADAGSTIAWWDNTAGDGSDWVEVPVSSSETSAMVLADLDGDGDLDVTGGGEGNGKVTARLNTYDGSCPAGSYRPGDRLALSATPDPGWEVGSWSGTDDDGSGGLENRLTMPAFDHTVTVDYVPTGVPCGDIGNFLTRCRANPAGNSLQARVVLTDTSHDGETVEVTFDGVAQQLTIVGNRAQISIPGALPGAHAVELTEPGMCQAPVDLVCP